MKYDIKKSLYIKSDWLTQLGLAQITGPRNLIFQKEVKVPLSHLNDFTLANPDHWSKEREIFKRTNDFVQITKRKVKKKRFFKKGTSFSKK